MADLYGPTDFTAYNLTTYGSGLGQLVFGSSDRVAEGLKRASSVTYVSKDSPPFLIMQGDQDQIVPPSQSQELYDKLKPAGAPATLVMLKNAGHGFVPVNGPIDPGLLQIGKTVADFFEQNVRNAQNGGRFFPETGKTVRGKFLDYWTTHGGLAQQGYPISDEMQQKSDTDGKTYTVQYFERAVFELHPENQPPNDVLLSLLGTFEYNKRYGTAGAPNQKPSTDNPLFFKETGKTLGGKFRAYWEQHGGLAQQGYPISDEFQERSGVDGKTYTVQYFESHPENQPPYDVLLSLLGKLRLQK